MPIKTYPFDAADYLTDEKLIEEYINLTAEENDPISMEEALKTVARARVMNSV